PPADMIIAKACEPCFAVKGQADALMLDYLALRGRNADPSAPRLRAGQHGSPGFDVRPTTWLAPPFAVAGRDASPETVAVGRGLADAADPPAVGRYLAMVLRALYRRLMKQHLAADDRLRIDRISAQNANDVLISYRQAFPSHRAIADG